MTRDRQATDGRRVRKPKVRTTPPKEGVGEFLPVSETKFKPLTENQRRLYSTIFANDCTFATGSAGTGKTHCAIAAAHEMFIKKQIKQIVLTKPFFEIDEVLGILPGDKDEKVAIQMRPMFAILAKLFGRAHLENLVSLEKVCFEPLGSILGNTYDDAVVIIDESQNTTPGQMKAVLTRLGQRSKIVVCGDYVEQKYISGRDGLEDALQRFEGKPGVGRIDFTEEDIVRSGFCRLAVLAYKGMR